MLDMSIACIKSLRIHGQVIIPTIQAESLQETFPRCSAGHIESCDSYICIVFSTALATIPMNSKIPFPAQNGQNKFSSFQNHLINLLQCIGGVWELKVVVVLLTFWITECLLAFWSVLGGGRGASPSASAECRTAGQSWTSSWSWSVSSPPRARCAARTSRST